MPSVIERLVAVHRDHLGCPDLGERIGEVIGGVSEKGKKKLWIMLKRLDLDPGFRGVLRARLGVKLDETRSVFDTIRDNFGPKSTGWFHDGIVIEQIMRIEIIVDRIRNFIRSCHDAVTYQDFPRFILVCGMGYKITEKLEALSGMSAEVCLQTLGVSFDDNDYRAMREFTPLREFFQRNPLHREWDERGDMIKFVQRNQERYASAHPNIKVALDIYLSICAYAKEFSNLVATIPEKYARLKVIYLNGGKKKNPDVPADEGKARDEDIEVPPHRPGPRREVVVPLPDDSEQKRGGSHRWERRDGGEGDGGQSDRRKDFEETIRHLKKWHDDFYRKDGKQERGRSEEEKPERSKRASKQFADTVYKSYSSKTRGDGTFGEGDDADVAEQVIFQDKSGTQFADPLDELVYKYNTQDKNKEFFKHYSANFDKRAADGITRGKKRGSKKRSKEDFGEPGVRRPGEEGFEKPGEFNPYRPETIEV